MSLAVFATARNGSNSTDTGFANHPIPSVADRLFHAGNGGHLGRGAGGRIERLDESEEREVVIQASATAHRSSAGPDADAAWPSGAGQRRGLGLRWRIIAVLLLVSILPLAIVGVGASVVFRDVLLDKTLELQRETVASRASAIDLYLSERLRAVQLVARMNGLAHWTEPGGLQEIFEALSRSYPGAFVDLGVIDGAGDHLAYLGPYDLKDKNYADAEWFHSVGAEGSYISDAFLGYRNVPHCVIAVRRDDGERRWFVRATIDNASLYSLVQGGDSGGGEAYLVSSGGRYQTPPRNGAVLDRSPIVSPEPHQGVRDRRVVLGGEPTLQVTSWTNGNRWLLVVQQSEREIMEPVRRATILGVLVVLAAVVLLVLTTVLATWQLTNQIDRANAQRDELSRDLLRSAKLASLGELSAGLAHEINNPLAIISAEQTNISDLIGDLEPPPAIEEDLLSAIARCRRQVERCAGITAKMLRFGRKSESRPEPTDVAAALAEITALMRKQSEVHDVDLRLDVEGGLPPVVLDQNELEQVLTNLINNAIHAIDGAGAIEVSARHAGREIVIAVRDSGCGIPPEDIDRIFQPFFTTKPVGQGTGLGLSVCFGIVHGWGGRIAVESAVGVGTTFEIRLPTLQGSRRAALDPGARSEAITEARHHVR